MIDFSRTPMGRVFFEVTLPALVKNLARLADGVERLVKLEETRAATKDGGTGEAQ